MNLVKSQVTGSSGSFVEKGRRVSAFTSGLGVSVAEALFHYEDVDPWCLELQQLNI